MPTWDILICSIPHRDELMKQLLAEIDRQLQHQDGVGVICYRDNLETPYGLKLAAMYGYSGADYVCTVDDDDFIAPDYVERITTALAEGPDYVGFPISYTVDGQPSSSVDHSLKHGYWANLPHMIVRDINQKNPMRREIALYGTWRDDPSPDWLWADDIRRTGRCRTEVYIPDPMYYYRFRSDDHWEIARRPLAEWEPLPEYPWLTQIGMR